MVVVRIAESAAMERIRAADCKEPVAVAAIVVAMPALTVAVVWCSNSVVVPALLLLLHYCGSSLWLYEHWQAHCTKYNWLIHSSVSLTLSALAYARL